MTEDKRFRMETIDDMMLPFIVDNDTANKNGKFTSYHTYETHRKEKCLELVDLLNGLWDENVELKHEVNCLQDRLDDYVIVEKEKSELERKLGDCKKLKGKRLNKIRNHRAVIEDLGGSIRAYKGKISQLNEVIDKIKLRMDDTGALTKRELEEILDGKRYD